jgi:hypothetical protein
MMFCLAKIAKLTHWEVRPEEEESKPIHYSVTLNPKTKLLDARFALASTIAQLKGLNKKFTFTLKGGNGDVLYEYKS